jgi:WD40 repeat protein
MKPKIICFVVLSCIIATAAIAAEPAVDFYGDPLPAGALFRLGTVRLRAEQYSKCVAFAPDGASIATGDYDGAKIWNARTGQKLKEFRWKGYQTGASSIAYSPDSKFIAIANEINDYVQIIDTDTATVTREFKRENGSRGYGGPIDNWIEFSPDGTKLAVMGTQAFTLYEMAGGKALFSLTPEPKLQKAFHSMALSPTGDRVALGGWNGIMTFHDLETGKILHSAETGPYRHRILSLAYSSDGASLAVSVDGKLCLWDAKTFKEVKELRGKSDRFQSHRHLSFIADNSALFTTEPEHMNIIDLNSAEKTVLRKRNEGRVFATSISKNRRTVALLDEVANTLFIEDIITGKPALELDGHTGSITTVALSSDGETAVTGSSDGTVRAWDTNTGKRKPSPFQSFNKLSTTGVSSVAYAPNGNYIVAAADHGKFAIADTKTGDIREFNCENNIHYVAVSPDSALIAFALMDDKKNPISLFDFATARHTKALIGHTDWIGHVAFTSDGKSLASASRDASIRIWDLETATTKRRWDFNTININFVAINPDGKSVAYDASDSLRSWSIETGQRLISFEGRFITGLGAGMYTPEGKVFIGVDSSDIIFWDTATGRQLTTFKAPNVTSMALSQDGKMLLTGHSDTSALIWKVPESFPAPAERPTINRRRSRDRKE